MKLVTVFSREGNLILSREDEDSYQSIFFCTLWFKWMQRKEVWHAAVHGVTESRIQLGNWTTVTTKEGRRKKEGGKEREESTIFLAPLTQRWPATRSPLPFLTIFTLYLSTDWDIPLCPLRENILELVWAEKVLITLPTGKEGVAAVGTLWFIFALNRTQTWIQLLSLKDSVKTKIHFQWLLPFLSCQTCDTFMSWMHNTEIYIG